MLLKRPIGCSRGGIVGCAVGIIVACQALPALAAPLLDFKDNAQFAQFRITGQTKIEPASENFQGKRVARIVFAPVPEGLRDYPAVVIEGPALAVRDFSSFEAISLWVKNPGPDDADLSLAIWDKDGNRAFPIPSTVTIKPGRWEQVVARLVLHGLDAKQIGSVHFYPAWTLLDEPTTLTRYWIVAAAGASFSVLPLQVKSVVASLTGAQSDPVNVRWAIRFGDEVITLHDLRCPANPLCVKGCPSRCGVPLGIE